MKVEINTLDKTSTEIVEKFQLPPTDAENIVGSFKEVVVRMSQADEELMAFGEPTEITEEVCAKAKMIRLMYVKTRTKNDEIHKYVKSNVLLRSRAIDGVRNIFKLQVTEKEDYLKNIETHFDRIKEEAVVAVEKERTKKLEEIGFADIDRVSVKFMSEEVWASFYENQKAGYEARLQKEKEDEAKIVRLAKIESLGKTRHAEIVDLFQFLEDKLMNLGELTEEEFLKLKADLVKKKIAYDKEQADLVEENKKIKKESDATAKKATEEKKKSEAKVDAANKQAAIVADQLRRKNEQEDEDREKLEAVVAEIERVAKNKKYKDFLIKNSVTQKDLNDGTALVSQNGSEWSLYKLVDKITIQ